MKTLLIALSASILIGCGANPMDSEETGVAWYSDYTIQDTYSIGKVIYAGADTILHVDDPVITYYSDTQIKAATVTVFHKGIGYPVSCAVHDKQVRVFSDVIYGAGPDIVFLPTDKIRFGIEAY